MTHTPSNSKAEPEPTSPETETDFLLQSYARLRHAITTTTTTTTTPTSTAPAPTPDPPILPTPSTLHTALTTLPTPSSPTYLHRHGAAHTHAHLLADILPALNRQSLSPRYFGFVTGGVLPIAEAADNLVSALDQNVQVHFPPPPPPPPPLTPAPAPAPNPAGGGGGGGGTGTGPSERASGHEPGWAHSACTAVEDAALGMVVALLELGAGWGAGRTFTAGATAANILGLACGREAVVDARAAAAAAAAAVAGAGEGGHGKVEGEGERKVATVAEAGLLAACIAGGVREVQVLTSMGHSSLGKAASVVGLGRGSVKELGVSAAEPWRLDLDAVERELQREADGVVSVIVVSAGEVNTGRFATNVLDMPKLRSLADRYGAWIHVDGGMHSLSSFGMRRVIGLILTNLAFGIFARVLPKTDEYLSLHANVAGLELADSIAADGHKLLNVVCYCCQYGHWFLP